MARKKKRPSSSNPNSPSVVQVGEVAPVLPETVSTPAATLTPAAVEAEEPVKVVPWTETDRRYWWAALAVLILGIGLRQWNLANFAYHPDEAIHAWYAYGFASYHYDPVYHGPVLYHLIALVYTIFGIIPYLMGMATSTGATDSALHLGANDFTARLVPSLLGIGLLAMAFWPARRWLGARGSLWCMALLAISPVMVSYQRRLLHDALVMVLTFGAVMCLQATLESPSDTPRGRRARIGLMVLLALFLATKANALFIIGMLASYWMIEKVRQWISTMSPTEKRLSMAKFAWVPMLCFVLISFAAELTLRNLPEEIVESNEKWLVKSCIFLLLLVTVWLLLPTRGSGVEPGLEEFSEVPPPDDSPGAALSRHRYQLRTYLGAGYAAAFVFAFFFGHGVLWGRVPLAIKDNPVKWAAQTTASVRDVGRVAWLGAVYGPALLQGKIKEVPGAGGGRSPLHNAPDWDEITDAMPKMLGYWGGQQKKPRLPGNHDYYLPLMALYELPIVLVAICGIVHAAWRRTRFTDLLLWWAFTSFTVYAIANEKVPWLLTHIMLPLAILGAAWLGQLKLTKAISQYVLAGATVLGAIFLLRGVSATNFERPADKHEPMFFAQTTEAFHDAVLEGMEKTRDNMGSVWVHQDKQWPAAWYFRDKAPILGQSISAWGMEPPNEPMRVAIHLTDADWQAKIREGKITQPQYQKIKDRLRTWKHKEVEYYIWTRASWPALQPRRFWRFWRYREVDLKNRPPFDGKGVEENGILTGGEFSMSPAVVSTPN